MIRLFTLSFIFILSFATNAQAQGSVVQCGDPGRDVRGVNTDPPQRYCDIYQRQLSYKEEADTLSAQLKERQENFARPRNEAYRIYQEDLEVLHSQTP